ncbi:hypothetical protein FO512_18315 [Bacillus cereus]|nr:hypothetical protein [Bacillus cereus]
MKIFVKSVIIMVINISLLPCKRTNLRILIRTRFVFFSLKIKNNISKRKRVVCPFSFLICQQPSVAKGGSRSFTYFLL